MVDIDMIDVDMMKDMIDMIDLDINLHIHLRMHLNIQFRNESFNAY